MHYLDSSDDKLMNDADDVILVDKSGKLQTRILEKGSTTVNISRIFRIFKKWNRTVVKFECLHQV